jgi:hypothetical protein
MFGRVDQGFVDISAIAERGHKRIDLGRSRRLLSDDDGIAPRLDARIGNRLGRQALTTVPQRSICQLTFCGLNRTAQLRTFRSAWERSTRRAHRRTRPALTPFDIVLCYTNLTPIVLSKQVWSTKGRRIALLGNG